MKINKRMINETALKREMLNELVQIPAWVIANAPAVAAAIAKYGPKAYKYAKNLFKVGGTHGSYDYFTRGTQAELPNWAQNPLIT